MTSALPPAYASFAPLFGRMTPAMAQILTGILQSLAKQMPIQGMTERHPTGDFVGYDGLENRGSLSNLLETEWLLRDIDPDDFARRVAEREVLYRRKDFADPGQRNTLAVILDCGPWILGRHRLIPLAALFYLAKRAELSGAQLLWIVPSDRGAPTWTTGLTEDSVRDYLGQVVASPLTASRLERLVEKITPEGRLDCWYVGAQETAEIATHPLIKGSLLIRSLYDADAPSAEVTIATGSGRTAKTVLTLPDDDICLAALRRSFAPEVQRAKPSAPREKSSADKELYDAPYADRWLIDRSKNAFIIRFDEGVLWQPFALRQDENFPYLPGLWIPIEPDEVLLGIGTAGRKSIGVAVAQPKAKNPQHRTRLTLIDPAKARGGEKAISRQFFGEVSFDVRSYDRTRLPALTIEVEGGQSQRVRAHLIPPDGRTHFFHTNGTDPLIKKSISEEQTIFQNLSYCVALKLGKEPCLVARSLSRNEQILSENWGRYPNGISGPYKVFFDSNSKLVAITEDGQNYQIIQGGQETALKLPPKQILLGFRTPHKGLAYIPTENRVVKWGQRGGMFTERTVLDDIDPAIKAVHLTPMNDAVFGLEVSEAGTPIYFVSLYSARRHGKMDPIDLTEAVAQAVTVRMDS